MRLFLAFVLYATQLSATTVTPSLFGTPTTTTPIVTGSSAFTFSHVVPANGTNVVLFVQAFGTTTIGSEPASSITFNGVSLTLLKSSFVTNGALTHQSDLYYLKNPTAATANVIITYPGTVAQRGGNAINYSGVDQTIVFGATGSASIIASPANVTTSVTTTYANSLLLYDWEAYAIGAGGASYTKDASYTDRAFSGFTSAAAAGDMGEKSSTVAGVYTVATTFNNGGAAFSGCTQQLIEIVGVQLLAANGQRSPFFWNRQRPMKGPMLASGLR